MSTFGTAPRTSIPEVDRALKEVYRGMSDISVAVGLDRKSPSRVAIDLNNQEREIEEIQKDILAQIEVTDRIQLSVSQKRKSASFTYLTSALNTAGVTSLSVSSTPAAIKSGDVLYVIHEETGESKQVTVSSDRSSGVTSIPISSTDFDDAFWPVDSAVEIATSALRSAITVNASGVSINSSNISSNSSSIATIETDVSNLESTIVLKAQSSAGKITKLALVQLDASVAGGSAITLRADQINIDGTTTFSSGYDPTDKLDKSSDDLDDVNDGSTYSRTNTTIIDGGNIRVGSGTKDSSLNGFHIGSSEIVGQSSGVDQVVMNTSGQITAGGGAVVLDNNGIFVDGSAGHFVSNSIGFENASNHYIFYNTSNSRLTMNSSTGIIITAPTGVFIESATTASIRGTSGGKAQMISGSDSIEMAGSGITVAGASLDINCDTTITGKLTLDAASGMDIEFTPSANFNLRHAGASGDFILRVDGSGELKLFGNAETSASIRIGNNTLAFYNTAPISKPTVSGSRGGNAALADLLTELANLGLITNSTT